MENLMRKSLMTAISAGVLAGVIGIVPANAKPGGDQTLHPDTGASGASYAVGTFWWDANHGGPAIIWKGGAPCTSGYGNVDYKETSLAGEDFMKATSSVRDYNLCDTALFDETGARSGGTNGWFDADDSGTYNLDVWDNRAVKAWWS